MPLLFTAFLSLGAGAWWGWRMAMFVPGVVMFLCGIAYYFLTQDTPDGDFAELRARGELIQPFRGGSGFCDGLPRSARLGAIRDLRRCFGMELTIDNIAALYFADYFHLALTAAGFVAASFGMMNLFARALGGIVSDRVNRRWGLRGRVAAAGLHDVLRRARPDAVLPDALCCRWPSGR